MKPDGSYGRELLFSLTKKDFIVTKFKGSGKGGQNRNKNETAARIKHEDSGAVAESQEFKSFEQNRKAAFKKLTQSVKFRIWYNQKVWEVMNKKTVDQVVAEQMNSENLRVEYRIGDKWIEVDSNETI